MFGSTNKGSNSIAMVKLSKENGKRMNSVMVKRDRE